MKFTLRLGKHQKSPSATALEDDEYQPAPIGPTPFEYVMVVPNRNCVAVMDKTNNVIMSRPMDQSAFKDLVESVDLLGPNPHTGTVDCDGIAQAILDHFDYWYSEVKKDGCQNEDIVDLTKEMAIYAVKKYPMVMACPVTGPYIISKVFNDVMERIENAPDD